MMTEPVSDFDTDYDGGVLNSGRDEPQQHHPHHHQNGRPRYDDDDYNNDNNNNEPHYMTGSLRGKPTSYFVNGDHHFTAKKIVFNHKYFRDMTHYLDHLTDKLSPNFGAIRKIHTPMGGRRIYDVNDLQPGGSYVAAGNEKFKRIPYDQIIAHERKKSPPFKYDANPVVHSKIFKSSARFGKQANQSIIIKVWPNGGEKKARRPRVVLLRQTSDWNMTHVIVMVNEMLKDDCNGAVESIYDTSGCKLSDVSSLEHNGVYVALTKRDRFKKAPYKDFATKDLHISPRPDRKGGLDPLFSRSNNSTSQSSPEHSNASSSQSVPVNGYSRRRPPKREEDQVFPAKPVKYNRSSERTRKVDLDKDEGGVFKAKGTNSNTRGAREVNDTRQTKVDLPLDQQKAQPVEDETPVRSKEDRNRPQHQQKGGFTEAKSNSRRPPPRAAQVKNHSNKKKEDDDDFIRDIKRRREQSAIKIQAGYRGYRMRKQLAEKSNKKTTGRRTRTSRNTTPRTSTQEPRQDWTPTPQNRGNNSQVTPSPPPAYDFREEEAAATRIQAGFRGFKTRKEVDAKKAANKNVERGQSELENYQSIAQDEAQKVVDNVSDRFDEEERAATKIQAGFRGHQVRRKVQAKAAQNESQDKNREEELAATKIQAGFRGFKTRSSLKGRNEPEKAPSPVRQPPPPTYDDDEDDEDEDVYDKAASKIQAGFKGYKVRKNLRI